MAAAAQNLCPVTLELGGKAPAIVCDDFPLKLAAERILFVKCLNAGQICTTVDHVFVPAPAEGASLRRPGESRPSCRRATPTLDSPDYTSIIDQRAFDRLLRRWTMPAARRRAVMPLLPGPAFDAATRKIAPHIVLDAPADCELMQREIFGPILPVCPTTRSTRWWRASTPARGRWPLPLQPRPRCIVQMLLDRVMSGGVSVNDALFHVGQHDLPFGGVGESGMGHYHGAKVSTPSPSCGRCSTRRAGRTAAMTSVRLNPLDSAWLFTESRATPNHVGGLLQFRLPEGAPKDYMRQLMAEFRNHREFTAPWNRRLKYAFNKNPVPVWIEDDAIDLEYHVRHAALPWPGGERELGELVGRLQSTPLDLSRPPWECTIIEGLEGDRFALFIKMHHSLIDGVSGMKLLQRAMSPDREKSRKLPPFWASGLPRPTRARDDNPLPTVANAAAMAVDALRGQAQHGAATGGRLRQDAQGPGHRRRHGGALHLAALGAQRPRAREAPLRHPAVSDGATAQPRQGGGMHPQRRRAGDLRRRAATLPRRARRPAREIADHRHPRLGAGRPTTRGGNAITFIIATLGTDIADARERLAAIRESVRHAKEHVQSLPGRRCCNTRCCSWRRPS
jgi:hypothetical protein